MGASQSDHVSAAPVPFFLKHRALRLYMEAPSIVRTVAEAARLVAPWSVELKVVGSIPDRGHQ